MQVKPGIQNVILQILREHVLLTIPNFGLDSAELSYALG